MQQTALAPFQGIWHCRYQVAFSLNLFPSVCFRFQRQDQYFLQGQSKKSWRLSPSKYCSIENNIKKKKNSSKRFLRVLSPTWGFCCWHGWGWFTRTWCWVCAFLFLGTKHFVCKYLHVFWNVICLYMLLKHFNGDAFITGKSTSSYFIPPHLSPTFPLLTSLIPL